MPIYDVEPYRARIIDIDFSIHFMITKPLTKLTVYLAKAKLKQI